MSQIRNIVLLEFYLTGERNRCMINLNEQKASKIYVMQLQVEYTEKFTDLPSRGEKTVAAKAADRNFRLFHISL